MAWAWTEWTEFTEWRIEPHILLILSILSKTTSLISSRHFKTWLPVVLWMGVIFFMSTDTGSAAHTSRFLGPLLHWLKPDVTREQFETVQLCVRKAGHLTEYALLAMIVARALLAARQMGSGRLAVAALAWGVAVLYAASDEWHQSFVPSRTASVGDVAIDAVGALLGLAVFFAWRKFRAKRAA